MTIPRAIPETFTHWDIIGASKDPFSAKDEDIALREMLVIHAKSNLFPLMISSNAVFDVREEDVEEAISYSGKPMVPKKMIICSYCNYYA